MNKRQFLQTCTVLLAAEVAGPQLTRGAEPKAAAMTAGGAARPRLFFPPERIASLRTRLARDTGLKGQWDKLLRSADEMLGVKLITQSEADDGPGANANYPAASRQLADMSLALGLAWQVTGEERYASKLREALLHGVSHERWSGREFLKRTPPWHSALWTAAFTVGGAAGCDALEGYLSAPERQRITAGIVRLGIEPILSDWVLPEKRIHALDSMGHNWWSVCVSGAGVGALALLGDDARAAGWVRAVDRALEGFFDYRGFVLQNKPANFDPAGAFYESVSYADYALFEYLLYRLARSNALPRTPPVRIPVLERMAGFFAHTLYPATGGFLSVNFGDSGLRRGGERTMRLLAAQGFAPALTRWYLSRVKAGPSGDPLGLLYLDDHAATAGNTLPPSVIYPVIGWAMLRDSWANDATLLAVKCGDTWGHAHADAGSFTLYHAGQPLLIDSGSCDYGNPAYGDYYRQSRAHNVVLFNGQGQPREDFAGNRGAKFPGHLHSLLDGFGLKYLYADATGPLARYLSRNYRHWLWLDGVILVFDDLLAHEAGTFDWLLHYDGEARHQGGDIELTNGPAKARVTMLFPEAPRVHEEQGLAEREPEKKVAYLALSTTEASREQKFIVAIVPQPPDSAAPRPTVELLREPDALGVRVRSGDQITDVYLNLQADGRRMHVNSNNTIQGWETDAYLLALTRPAGSAAATPQNVTRTFVAAGSYLRRAGQTVLDSVSKVDALFQAGEELDVRLHGQDLMDVALYSAAKPARLTVNGKLTPFEHAPGERLTRFQVRENPKPGK